MGYIRHHAIVVTSWNDELINKAHQTAKEIFGIQVSELIPSKINRYQSFFVAPDGSKEGWAMSEDSDKEREKFLNYLDSLVYEDGSSSISYAELFYGDDEGESMVTKHN